MCRYTFHHYTRCGHICGFAFQTCVEFLNLLRRSSQPGSNHPELSCNNIKVEHDLFSTKGEVDCLQCELDWPEQVSANGTKKPVHNLPDYVPIEGLASEDPIITAKTQWQWPTNKSRKREFNDAFLELDFDGDHKSDTSNESTVKHSTIANASPSSTEIFDEFIDVPLPLKTCDRDTADEVEDKEDCGPGPAKKRNDSISEDFVVIGTDIPNTQAERVSSQANDADDDDSDEDDFYSMWSDSDSDDNTEDATGPIMRFGDTEDTTSSIRRQLERFTFTCPVPRSTPRPPESPPCSPRTLPRPRPERLPLYVGFPGQPPERSPRTRRPSSMGNYVDARTELQSPVFDGFPGIFPDEDELGLRSPGLVSFPRFVVEDVNEEEKGKEKEKGKAEAGKSTGTVLGLRDARFASGSGRAATLLKGLNVAMPRK